MGPPPRLQRGQIGRTYIILALNTDHLRVDTFYGVQKVRETWVQVKEYLFVIENYTATDLKGKQMSD